MAGDGAKSASLSGSRQLEFLRYRSLPFAAPCVVTEAEAYPSQMTFAPCKAVIGLMPTVAQLLPSKQPSCWQTEFATRT